MEKNKDFLVLSFFINFFLWYMKPCAKSYKAIKKATNFPLANNITDRLLDSRGAEVNALNSSRKLRYILYQGMTLLVRKFPASLINKVFYSIILIRKSL